MSYIERRQVWLERHDARVAEVAEALGVPTDLIYAVTPQTPFRIVFYSKPEDVSIMYRVRLLRDADGVLRRAGDDVEVDAQAVLADPSRLNEYL